MAIAWETAQSWDDRVKIEEPAPALPTDPARVTLEKAIRAYLDEVTAHGSANTLKNYRQLMKELTAFAADRGHVMLDQFGPNDIREFRASWTVSPQTGAKNPSTLKTFFEFSVERMDRAQPGAPRGEPARPGCGGPTQ